MNRGSVVLAMALFLSGCATPPPSSTPVAPSDTAESGWQRLDLPNGDHAGLASIAATAHDVVIVGGRDMAPVAWASHDGGPWMSELLPERDAFAATVLAFDDRVLAVGGMQTNRCAHPAATVFWVRAADGRWSVAPFDQLFCGGAAGIVATSGGRLAMLGSGTADVPFAWFSGDGLRWVGRPVRANVYPQVIAPSAGGFAALGRFVDDGWWFGRSDGDAGWAIVPLGQLVANAEPYALADTGRGYIAWFEDPDAVGALSSRDGAAWHRVDVTGLSGVRVEQVEQNPSGYVLLGLVDAGPRLFVSRDGVNWRSVPGPIDVGQGQYRSLALAGNRAILLGTIQAGPEPVSAAWTGPARLFEP